MNEKCVYINFVFCIESIILKCNVVLFVEVLLENLEKFEQQVEREKKMFVCSFWLSTFCCCCCCWIAGGFFCFLIKTWYGNEEHLEHWLRKCKGRHVVVERCDAAFR